MRSICGDRSKTPIPYTLFWSNLTNLRAFSESGSVFKVAKAAWPAHFRRAFLVDFTDLVKSGQICQGFVKCLTMKNACIM